MSLAAHSSTSWRSTSGMCAHNQTLIDLIAWVKYVRIRVEVSSIIIYWSYSWSELLILRDNSNEHYIIQYPLIDNIMNSISCTLVLHWSCLWPMCSLEDNVTHSWILSIIHYHCESWYARTTNYLRLESRLYWWDQKFDLHQILLPTRNRSSMIDLLDSTSW